MQPHLEKQTAAPTAIGSGSESINQNGNNTDTNSGLRSRQAPSYVNGGATAAMTEPAKSWCDVIPVHPAAELFPMMSHDELVELRNDIQKNGLTAPVVLWTKSTKPSETESLLDDRNRLDAMQLVGLQTIKNSMLYLGAGCHPAWPEKQPRIGCQ